MLSNGIQCKYHHQQAAAWICDGCETPYCESCIPSGHSRHWGRNGPRCPLCNKHLSYQSSHVEVEPFWNMLPHFFSYPLHGNAMTMIGIVALFSALLPVLGLLFLIGGLFLLSVVVKYSFLIIDRRAHNDEVPPSIGQVLERDEHYLFIKLVFVMVVLYGATIFLSGESLVRYTILNGLVTLALPAVTIILAIQKSVTQALNPLVILSFMMRIGWAYLLVWFCYQVVASGPNFIVTHIVDDLPIFIVFPTAVALSLYFWFVANCMLGYAVFQYREELGQPELGIQEQIETIAAEDFEKQRIVAEAYIQTRENNAEGARKLVRPMLDKYQDDTDLHLFYHRLLGVLEDHEALHRHADYCIEFLLRRGDRNNAAKVYLDTQAKLAGYQPKDVSAAYQIAQLLNTRGEKKRIVQLLNNLHKRDPKHPDIAPAYYLLAKIYSEQFGRDDQAKKIIDFLLDRFPQTPIRKDLVAYKKVLAQL